MNHWPLYNEQATCPHCRCQRVGTEYRMLTFCGDEEGVKEYFNRKCSCCGYEWLERTMAYATPVELARMAEAAQKKQQNANAPPSDMHQ